MMTVPPDGSRRRRGGPRRFVRVALSLAIAVLSAALLHGQSQRILDVVAIAKSEKKKAITIAGPRLEYRLAGALEQVLQQHSASAQNGEDRFPRSLEGVWRDPDVAHVPR